MVRTSVLSALVLLTVVGAVAVGTVGALTTGGAVSPDGGAPAVDGSFAEIVSVANTTNYLVPDGETSETFVRSNVDVAAAAGMSADRLHAHHDNLVFDTLFESAPQAEFDREQLVREWADEVETDLDRIDARHEALLSGFADGSVSRETFLRRLARLSVQEEEIQRKINHTTTRVEETPGLSLSEGLESRLSSLPTGLLSLPNPVEDRIEAGLAGQRDPLVVYASGSDTGIVLASVVGDEFVRTATLRNEYAPGEPDQFEQTDGPVLSLAYERGSEVYPWAYDNLVRTPQIGGASPSVYRITIEHAQGTLETYLSGGSRNVFHEIQTQDPDQVPITGRVSNATESLNVTVDTTNPSGPVRVSLIQRSTDAPLNGSVSIDGQPVGETGTNGELYTVQPDGPFRVDVTTGANNVSVAVPASEG